MKETMVVTSPLGNIRLLAEDGYLLSLQFTEDPEDLGSKDIFLLEVKSQVDAYFQGDLKLFNIPVALGGTEFQQKVWMEVNKIPYGKTASYQQIAKRLDSPKSVRAVGGANGVNPILVIIPCHRIISQTGELNGYAGGLWRKLKLLQLESRDQPGKPYSLGF